MNRSFAITCLLIAVVGLTSGCKHLFPSEDSRTKAKWESFEEVQASFDKVVPHETTLEDLRKMGFDPMTTPNIKILTYLDLIERFIPNASIQMKDLHQDVRDCIESKDCCRAYELFVNTTHNRRYGNLFLDVFGFKKKTHINGWNFRALIIAKDEKVVYKLRSGEPNVNRYEKKIKPLGPLQELDSMVGRALSGMF
jgi:hypothetical protein